MKLSIFAVSFLGMIAMLATPAMDEPDSPISWSTTDFSQTLYPGAKTRVEEHFRSRTSLKHVGMEVMGELKGLVGVEPTTFACAEVANAPCKFVVIFQTPSGTKRTTLKGRVELFVRDIQTSQRTLIDTVAVILKIDSSVKQDFMPLAQALESENFSAKMPGFLQKFAPSQRVRVGDMLTKLDRDSRLRQARIFREARLTYGTQTSQTYTAPWKKGDVTSEVEFTLDRQYNGEWLITSW